MAKLPSWDESTPLPSATPEQSALPKWEESTPVQAENNSPTASAIADEILATPKGDWSGPQQITPEELDEISKRTGTSVDKLKQAATFFTGGVPLKGEEPTVAGTAAGLAGRAGRVALSIPQAVYKKLVADDKDEQALDILDALARKKQSYVADIFDVAGSIPLGAGAYKGATAAVEAAGGAIPKAVPFLATGPVAGGLAGLGASEKGKELEDVATGAAIGSAFTVAPQVMGKIADQAKVLGSKYAKEVTAELRKKQPALEEIFQDFAQANAKSISTTAGGLSKVKLDSLADFTKSVSPELKAELAANATKIPAPLVEKFLTSKGAKGATEADVRTFLAAKQFDNQFKRQFGTSIRQIQGRVKPEQFEEMYKDLLRKDIYAQNINAVTRDWSPAKKFAYKGLAYISASKPTTMLLDDLYGTNGERILDDMAVNYNLKYARPVQEIADTVYKEASKVADVPDAGKRIIAGDTAKELEPIREYFAKVRDIANDLGAAIPKAPNYFPRMKLPPAELSNALRKEFDDVVKEIDLAKADDKAFKQLLQVPKVKELYSVVKDLSDSPIKTGQDLINNATVLLTSPQEMRTGLNKVMSAALAAGEETIPDWARDWNTRRVMSRWASNTFKSLALGDGIRKLGVLEQSMLKAKDPVAAKFYNNLKADLLGGKKGTVAAALDDVLQRREERLTELAEKAEAANKPAKRIYYNTQKNLPQFGNWFKNWTYATLLGGRAKPALQNITSAYLQNAGDIGYARTQRYMADAFADVASKLEQPGKLVNFVKEEVYDRGLVAPGWRGEMDALITGRPVKGKLAGAFGKIDQKARDLAMSVFTMSEITARALTASMGKRLSKDLMTDPKLQRDFITSLPSPSYQRSITRALKSGDLQSVEDEVIRYMNATNMFNYQSFSQSQFVRDMGPAFSMFTLWPSMALGRVAKDFVTSGGKRASARLATTIGVPFLALFALDYGLSKTDAKDQPAYQLAFGKSGLADQTLLSAFPTNVEGRSGLISAPIPGTIVQAGKALSGILSQDSTEAEKLTKETFKTYLPFVSLYNKFVQDQLPLWQGELPEK